MTESDHIVVTETELRGLADRLHAESGCLEAVVGSVGGASVTGSPELDEVIGGFVASWSRRVLASGDATEALARSVEAASIEYAATDHSAFGVWVGGRR